MNEIEHRRQVLAARNKKNREAQNPAAPKKVTKTKKPDKDAGKD